MTNRSARIPARNYAPTDTSFRIPRGNTSPSTVVGVSHLDRRGISPTVKSVLSYAHAYVIATKDANDRFAFARWKTSVVQQIGATFRKRDLARAKVICAARIRHVSIFRRCNFNVSHVIGKRVSVNFSKCAHILVDVISRHRSLCIIPRAGQSKIVYTLPVYSDKSISNECRYFCIFSNNYVTN